MSGPCACFTYVYVQNLLATHAFAVTWRLVCTSCRSSLTSYSVSCLIISHPFMASSPLGLGFVWLWAFPHSAHYFAFFCSLAFPVVPFYYSYCNVIWAKPTGPFLGLLLILLSMTQYDHCVFYYIACRLLCHIYFLLGILDPFSFLGHPRSFLIPCSNGLLLTPLGFPNSITLYFTLGAHGLAINSLLSLLALLQAYCGPFLLYYITYYPWVCYFTLSRLL